MNTGTAPKLPDDPTWPSLIDICGLQCVPNKNSVTATDSKKRSVSNNNDNTIPSVIKMANIDAYFIVLITMSSTKSRALNLAVTKFSEYLNAIRVMITITIDFNAKLILVEVS